jgi:hypothetical protein
MTERTAPEIRQIPVRDFDTSLLPPDARAPGTEAFEVAVITYFASHYAARGWNAAVTVDDEFIRIVAVPETGVEPKEYVLGLLQHGFLTDALPLLEVLDGMLDDPDIAYNRGVCLGELGRVADSIPVLQRCIRLDPYHTDAHVALGSGERSQRRQRGGRRAPAQRARTAARQPVRGAQPRGRARQPRPLRRGAAAVPPGSAGLAGRSHPPARSCRVPGTGGRQGGEGGHAVIRAHRQGPSRPSRRGRGTHGAEPLGAKELHDRVSGQPRLDAVMYMRGAMETFAKMPRQQVGEIVMEIAQLGQSGLAINDPREALHPEAPARRLLGPGARLDDARGLPHVRPEHGPGDRARARVPDGPVDERGQHVSAMPKAYWETIAPLIEKARGFLENGESVEPIAFVGSFEKGP